MKNGWILAALPLLLLSCGSAPRQDILGAGLAPSAKADRFVERGYDPSPAAGGSDDLNAYMKRHGVPEKVSSAEIVNRHDGITDEMVTLVYKRYEMRYYRYAPREAWKAPPSTLMAVHSRAGGKYLFGIEIGMARGKVEALLGLEKGGSDTVELTNAKGHATILMFKGDSLEKIIWDYSRE
jgi:hypothetical protein